MINVRIQTPEVQKLSPKITVIGVGGAGGNAVNNKISSGLEGCEFLVCNTDAQALEGSLSENRIQLGANVTGGLGAGAKPDVGEQAAHESLDEVMQFLEGSNMAFVTAGMGGGTGTGGAPVLAKACRDAGILTVGVVTKPFHFEGTHRMKQAEAGIHEMQDYVDTLIVIPNQNLFRVANEKTTFAEAFKLADSVLQSGVRGVTDLMVMPGLINLDFADIRSAMLEMGKAMMGTGEGEGERRSIEAAEAAINNPLLDDVSMKGARGVIINVTGGQDMTLFEVDEACNRIRDEVDPNANIIFGSTFDEKLEGRMRVSVVATGIDAAEAHKSSTTSGIKVTAVSKPQEEPKVEEKTEADRPRPQTDAVRAATLSARPLVPNRPVNLQKSYVNAPQTQALSQSQPVQKSEEPEADMFEQQEFVASKATGTQAVQNTVLRGTTHEGHFIPPKPVVPEPQEPSATGFGPQVTRQQYQPQNHVPSGHEAQGNTAGLVLRPPVPGQNADERRKSPSLFERITGVRRGDEDEQGDGSSKSSGSFHAGLRAQRNSEQPSQGQLNIDSPSASRSDNAEDLDIPAFLRRQAN